MGWIPNKWTLTQGHKAQILALLVDENGKPINISGASAISLAVKKADGSILERPAYNGLAVGFMDTLWLYTFEFSAEEVNLFPLAKDQSVQLRVIEGSERYCINLPKALTVIRIDL